MLILYYKYIILINSLQTCHVEIIIVVAKRVKTTKKTNQRIETGMSKYVIVIIKESLKNIIVKLEKKKVGQLATQYFPM